MMECKQQIRCHLLQASIEEVACLLMSLGSRYCSVRNQIVAHMLGLLSKHVLCFAVGPMDFQAIPLHFLAFLSYMSLKADDEVTTSGTIWVIALPAIEVQAPTKLHWSGKRLFLWLLRSPTCHHSTTL
jgi:hypothetical protein